MKKCYDCRGNMRELTAKTPEGVGYKYFECRKCGEEVLDMNQLHNVAEKYRKMKRYHVKLSRWGQSLGFRIPKELAKKYKFRDEEEVTVVSEKSGIKVIPA